MPEEIPDKFRVLVIRCIRIKLIEIQFQLQGNRISILRTIESQTEIDSCEEDGYEIFFCIVIGKSFDHPLIKISVGVIEDPKSDHWTFQFLVVTDEGKVLSRCIPDGPLSVTFDSIPNELSEPLIEEIQNYIGI